MSPAAEATPGRRLAQLGSTDVGVLKGVGPRKRAALEAMGLTSVLDLLTWYPRRYADRTNVVAIDGLSEGDEVVVSGEILRVQTRRPRGRAAIVELVLGDGTGTVKVVFFNQPWRARQLGQGMGIVVWGKVDRYRDTLQLVNPLVDLVGDRTGRIVPIYPQSEKAGVGSLELADYVGEVLERAKDFADPLPAADRTRLGLLDRTAAFNQIHRPDSLEERDRARERLAFDELFRLQLALVLRKRAAAAGARGIAHLVDAPPPNDLVATFVGRLAFELTGAQRHAIGEIARDLAAPEPMHRLLQGDVGSGKTVVALAALLYGVQGGYQGALMVPTEVLAEQHYLAARRLLAEVMRPDATRLLGERPLSVALLTSRTPGGERQHLLDALAHGNVDLLVGTHALITDDVRFRRLGVVVIDEQHRFGVDQRAALREKGSADGEPAHDPDLLVMTATPIPRTAAMTVYGDLDASVIDELPAGRSPVRTFWLRGPEDEPRAWQAVRKEVARGRQAFVVCPFIRPSEEGGGEDDGAELDDDELDEATLFAPAERPPPRAATSEYERLREGELAGLAVGLLHGQLPPREKESVMAAFRDHKLDVLVATTVIEVGVDVPDATVMVIEDADRFGIAQLHQLRGRVGRGSEPAACFLLGDPITELGERRLQAVARTNDGFELAEEDLELRGEGTVLGARQRGRSDLKLASLRRDRRLIERARELAESIVADDPTLEHHPLLRDELELFVGEAAAYLARS